MSVSKSNGEGDEEQRERCETCRFWKPNHINSTNKEGTNGGYGWCRRNPPTVNQVERVIHLAWLTEQERHEDVDVDPQFSSFPCVGEEQWCGEWQAKRTPLPVVEAAIAAKDHPLLAEPIGVLRLSNRAMNALTREGIETVADLRGFLMRNGQTRRFGASSRREACEALAKHGLWLKGDA